jgi:hypothetical protein
VGILVPRRPSAFIDPGSAIVCQVDEMGLPIVSNDYIDVYFESNRYGASNIPRFADWAYVAASRMRNAYPTSATALLRAEDVELVGWLRLEGHRIELLGFHDDLFDAWRALCPDVDTRG